MTQSQALRSRRSLELFISTLLRCLAMICGLMSSAEATPALDADQSWGRGAHLGLINPALTIDDLSVWGMSYDLTTPPLNEWSDRSALRWGHELGMSFSIPQRYALTVGFSHQPSDIALEGESDLAQESQATSSDDARRWWSLSQALRWGDVSFGLTVAKVTDKRLIWISGISAHLTPWLTTSLTLQDLSHLSTRRGHVALGLGVKPLKDLQLGVTLTPTTDDEGVSGGALDMRAQWTLWRGLALELGWLGVRGEAYGSGEPAQWGLLRGARLEGERTRAQDPTSYGGSLWRFGLTWRGPWGLRAEGASSGSSSARLGLRWRSLTPSAYVPPSPRRVMIVSVSQSQELVATRGWFEPASDRAPFFQVLRKLERIAQLDADEVAGVVLVLKSELGWAQAEELRAAVQALRLRNHLVFAYLPQASLRSYLVAAACDSIWASPTAEIALNGLLVERIYLRELLDRLEITPEVIAAGEYKSAPELYTRRSPSPEAEEVDQRLIDARFKTLVAWLADRAQQQAWSTEASPALTRGKRLISLRKLKDQEPPNASERARAVSWIKEGPYSAQGALKSGLIDAVVSPVKLESKLIKTFPRARLSTASLPVLEPGWTPHPKIAVIHAVGPIGGGAVSLNRRGPRISATQYLPLIKRAAYDPQVRGVVLRIDSPGGTITDADLLWVELQALAQRKPLAVSMGNVAASGGYYIAAPAHKIFASNTSITGSIGVFAGKVDLSAFLEKWGVNIHRLQRGEGGEARSFLTPWSDKTRARVQAEINRVYELFLERILTARGSLNREKLLPLAGGRVWTGEEAHERGLVDVRGGLLDAVKWVTVRAGLARREHRVISLTPRGRPLISVALGLLGLGAPEVSSSSLHSQRGLSFTEGSPSHALIALFESALSHLPSSVLATLGLMSHQAGAPLAIDPRF